MTTDSEYNMGFEFETLDAETKAEVMMVVEITAEDHRARSIRWRNGDVYAHPHADGISWGVNGGEHGFCIARGIGIPKTS